MSFGVAFQLELESETKEEALVVYVLFISRYDDDADVVYIYT